VDIGAEAAWDITTGDRGVIVAVIDTGIRTTHQDLAGQLWRNAGEVPANGIDDDANGYVDDVHGINASAETGDPTDDNGHGTHVAGTIGAMANGGGPHVGVAWQVQIMACKSFNSAGSAATSDGLKCLNYAIRNGARIINASWGGRSRSQATCDAIAAARDAGILFVASAGNDGRDNDSVPHYPSGFDLENVISVAALDRTGNLASYSNQGRESVHLAAPGTEIVS
jgi:subtilisin family serine protease